MQNNWNKFNDQIEMKSYVKLINSAISCPSFAHCRQTNLRLAAELSASSSPSSKICNSLSLNYKILIDIEKPLLTKTEHICWTFSCDDFGGLSHISALGDSGAYPLNFQRTQHQLSARSRQR